MLDHVSIGVRDIAAARRFYNAALAPLGYRCLTRHRIARLWPGGPGLLDQRGRQPGAGRPASGLHFCFTAPTRASVDAFHAAALAAGGKDNGAPGLRPDSARIHAGFVVDPAGYRNGPIAVRRADRHRRPLALAFATAKAHLCATGGDMPRWCPVA